MNIKELIETKLLEDPVQRDKILRELNNLFEEKRERYSELTNEERKEYKSIAKEYSNIKILYNQKLDEQSS